MTLAALVGAIALSAVTMGWSTVRVRSARQEARQASEVALSSLLFAVAACEDSTRSRKALDETRRRVKLMDEELIAINRRIVDAGAEVPTRNVVLGGKLIRERQRIGEMLGRRDG